MKRRRTAHSRTVRPLWALILFVTTCGWMAAEPAPQALSAFNGYVSSVELRLNQQHRSQLGFLALPALGTEAESRLLRGELLLEQLTPTAAPSMPGAMLHHWRGSAFAAGATASDFERMMRDFNSYPQRFQPQVLQARVLAQQRDHYQAWMRVRQRHVLTVVMDTTYDVTFGQLDPQHGYSFSRSTRISEIDAPGTTAERALGASEEHGFLWRLNTYWSYEERDGGLYMQIESVSLTRDIPRGLAWAVRPFVESIPRESLEFTLRSTRDALRTNH